MNRYSFLLLLLLLLSLFLGSNFLKGQCSQGSNLHLLNRSFPGFLDQYFDNEIKVESSSFSSSSHTRLRAGHHIRLLPGTRIQENAYFRAQVNPQPEAWKSQVQNLKVVKRDDLWGDDEPYIVQLGFQSVWGKACATEILENQHAWSSPFDSLGLSNGQTGAIPLYMGSFDFSPMSSLPLPEFAFDSNYSPAEITELSASFDQCLRLFGSLIIGMEEDSPGLSSRWASRLAQVQNQLIIDLNTLMGAKGLDFWGNPFPQLAQLHQTAQDYLKTQQQLFSLIPLTIDDFIDTELILFLNLPQAYVDHLITMWGGLPQGIHLYGLSPRVWELPTTPLHLQGSDAHYQIEMQFEEQLTSSAINQVSPVICTSKWDHVVEATLGDQRQKNEEEGILVSPNPFNDRISLSLPPSFTEKPQRCSLRDATGRLVWESNLKTSTPKGNTLHFQGLENLPAGMYHLVLVCHSKVYTQRVLKIKS